MNPLPCKPWASGRRCETHDGLPLYPDGMCREGRAGYKSCPLTRSVKQGPCVRAGCLHFAGPHARLCFCCVRRAGGDAMSIRRSFILTAMRNARMSSRLEWARKLDALENEALARLREREEAETQPRIEVP